MKSLKPSGCSIYHKVQRYKNSTFWPHSVFMCFVWISGQAAIISIYSNNWLVFITETESVYCVVRTEPVTRRAIYIYRNTEARLYNHCCSGRAISITYSECVSVVSGIQRAMRMRPIVICGLPGYTNAFPLHLIKGMILKKKLLNIKCVFWFSLQLLSEIFSHSKKN